MKIKIFHVAERYHFYDGVHHAQVKPYIIWKKSSCFTKRFISIQNIKCKENSGQNLTCKDFRNRMKEKCSGGKRQKPYYRFKKLLYVIDTKAFSRKLGKYKLSLQKIYICNLWSNADLTSRGSYCLSSLFLQLWQSRKRNRWKIIYYQKRSWSLKN